MRVNIAVVGRFHAFNLAKELQDKNLLNKLITTYPKLVNSWRKPIFQYKINCFKMAYKKRVNKR